MRFRLFIGAMLVCALSAANGAGAAVADPVYRGSTAQDRKIRVEVGKRSIRIKQFKIELSCRDGSILILDEAGFLRTRVRGNGSFRDVQYGRTDTVRIRGKRSKRVVRGRLKVNDKLKNGLRCGSKWVRFTARPGGG